MSKYLVVFTHAVSGETVEAYPVEAKDAAGLAEYLEGVVAPNYTATIYEAVGTAERTPWTMRPLPTSKPTKTKTKTKTKKRTYKRKGVARNPATATKPTKNTLKNHGKPWSKAQRIECYTMYSQGKKVTEIAKELGRTPKAIRNYIYLNFQ